MIIAIADSSTSSITNGDVINGVVRHCYTHADIDSSHWLAVVYDDGSDETLTANILNRIQARHNPRRFTHSGLLPRLAKLPDRPNRWLTPTYAKI
jgi:hypothetical protein